MKELLVILATAMPEEKLVADLEEALSEHKIFYTDETRNNLAGLCQMMILRTITKGSNEKAQELLNDMRRTDERENLFNINPS